MSEVVVFGISFGFPELSRCDGQIAHVLLTRSPLVYPRRGLTARLACVKHAASVRPEPGSNSPLKSSDGRSEDRIIDSWSIPARVGPRKSGTGSYQRTVGKHRGTGRVRTAEPADGALQINASTFGTLLSSQGSSAHRRQPLGIGSGQPDETYRLGQSESNSFRLVPAPSTPRVGRCCRPSGLTQTPPLPRTGGEFRPGPAARPEALRPAAPWRQEEHYGPSRRRVKSGAGAEPHTPGGTGIRPVA